jgi:hypothetical protein
MKVVQVQLYSNEKQYHNGKWYRESLTTWIDTRPGLKEGVIISLKDFKPEQKWIINKIFDSEHEASDFEFHRKWDNNDYSKHKGLDL